MGFLTPLFLLGIAGLAVPIVIHMIQRERKDVIDFPSLMFVRKIPFHSFRRQRIRHWFLLLMRCAALVCLIMAFARPFVRSPALAAAADGAREVVVLLDRSYSMGMGNRWATAQADARAVLDGLAPDDQATVILFDDGARVGPRSTTERASLDAFVANADVGSGSTRFGPALKLAEGIFEGSSLPRLEAVLISDFQQLGVESAQGVRFPPGTEVTTRPVGGDVAPAANVSVAGVLFQREYFSGRERIQLSARLTNRGDDTITGLGVTLEMADRDVEALTADLPPHGSTTVDFAPVTLGDRPVPGVVRVEPDALPADDAFYFVVAPGQVVTVLVAGRGAAGADENLYLMQALGIGSAPAFDVRRVTLETLAPSDLSDRQVVILNDTGPPAGEAARALEEWVQAGGGLWIIAGERGTWPSEGQPALLPGRLAAPVDRGGRGGALGYVDYSHPVFELFGAPRSGDVTAARFFRFRPVEPLDDARVLARFDDGNPALVERSVGAGTVLLWASTIDSFWNDFAKKAVYLPFVHRVAEHLADYTPPIPWFSSGHVLDLGELDGPATAAGTPREYVVMSPTGSRLPVDMTGGRTAFINLEEQGLYEVHDATMIEGEPSVVAVNVDLAESDLSAVDPQELASMVTGRATGARPTGPTTRTVAPGELERQFSLWWYLLVAAAVLFITETLVSNRLSRVALSAD